MPLLQSPSITALASALAAAQAQITTASKDSTNPHFKVKYADLASVWSACRVPLAEQGLSVYQGIEANGGAVTVTTMLLHKSGEYLGSALTMTANPATPQGVGSCITYARRYALAAAVGVAPEDDDGHAGSERVLTGRAPTQPPVPPAPPVKATPADAAILNRAQAASQFILKRLGPIEGKVVLDRLRQETDRWPYAAAVIELEKRATDISNNLPQP
jgi:hypothetical protein